MQPHGPSPSAEGAPARRPARLAVAGAGFVGRGLVRRCARFARLDVVALADRDLAEARAALGVLGPRALDVAVHADPLALVDEGADAVVDCTGDAELGARLALGAIARGLAVFAGAECDAAFGPALARRARERGVLYSGGGGDEHAEAYRLVREVEDLGFEVVAAGKFKRFLDPAATPESVAPWAVRHRQSPRMLASFADGTKMAVEMAILANATGLVPDVRGMHRPELAREEVAARLTDGPGGVLSRRGVVEIVRGARPPASVFVVGRSDDPDLARDLAYLGMGPGPTHLFHKPYHLAAVELAASVARAVEAGLPAIAPRGAAVAAVLACAKRDLAPGERLDHVGGRTFHGLVDRAEAVAADGLLPVGLARGARVRRRVARGEPIRRDDVELAVAPELAELEAESLGLAPGTAWNAGGPGRVPGRAAPAGGGRP